MFLPQGALGISNSSGLAPGLLLSDESFPAITEAPLNGYSTLDTVTVAVQINGKLRGTFDAPRGAENDALERTALALPNVRKHLDGKTPRRVVVVKGTLVNVVV